MYTFVNKSFSVFYVYTLDLALVDNNNDLAKLHERQGVLNLVDCFLIHFARQFPIGISPVRR